MIIRYTVGISISFGDGCNPSSLDEEIIVLLCSILSFPRRRFTLLNTLRRQKDFILCLPMSCTFHSEYTKGLKVRLEYLKSYLTGELHFNQKGNSLIIYYQAKLDESLIGILEAVYFLLAFQDVHKFLPGRGAGDIDLWVNRFTLNGSFNYRDIVFPGISKPYRLKTCFM